MRWRWKERKNYAGRNGPWSLQPLLQEIRLRIADFRQNQQRFDSLAISVPGRDVGSGDARPRMKSVSSMSPPGLDTRSCETAMV